MHTAFRTFAFATTVALATTAATVLAVAPAIAMPVAPQVSQTAIVKVAGWATRAEGRRHTYPETYGYGYAQQGYGGYDGWGDDGYAQPYYGYGRAAPPAYGYDDDVYGY